MKKNLLTKDVEITQQKDAVKSCAWWKKLSIHQYYEIGATHDPNSVEFNEDSEEQPQTPPER